MANTTTSTNMLMPIPIVGQDPGPQWATDVNSCLGIIDQHDHSAGLGVQITPAGLNINSALSMQSNFLTLTAGVSFDAQLLTPANTTMYVNGTDLYFVDGVGNNIRMTQSGSVSGSAGTITGLPSGTASASYAAGVFVFQSATNTGANIDGASFVLRNNSASSNGLTLAPPNAMGANYTLTLPSLPAATKILVLDTLGSITASYDVDNTSLTISTNVLSVKDGGINTAKLADASVTPAKMAALGQIVSSGSGNYSSGTVSGGFTDVTGMSCTITTTGRPVRISVIPDPSIPFNPIGSVIGSSITTNGLFQIDRSGSAVAYMQVGVAAYPAAVATIDTPAAGTYTYKLRIGYCTSGTVFWCKLLVYQL